MLTKADSLVDKNPSCPRTKLSNSQTSILDGVKIEVLLSHIAVQMRSKNTDVTDSLFTSPGAAEISPKIVLNLNAKTKEKKREREKER